MQSRGKSAEGKSPSQAQRLHESIAEALDRYITEKSLTQLPPVEKLIGEFHVCDNTIYKAIHLLEQRGRVKCWKGRRTEVCNAGPGKKESARLPEKISALYSELKESVLSGDRKVGDQFPKFDFLTAKYRMTRRYLSRVMGLLENDGLIHKEGKKWIAGPAPAGRPAYVRNGSSNGEQVALIVVHVPHIWTHLTRSNHLSRFPMVLIEELEKAGIRALVVGSDPSQHGEFFTAGFDRILRLVESLGNRYRGAVAAMNSLHAEMLQEEEKWVRMLTTGNRPCIWFDMTDKGWGEAPLDRSLMRNCRRCHMDIEGAVKLCVETLVSLGHRAIAIPYFSKPQWWEWSMERARMVEKIARECSPSPEIISQDIGGEIWPEFLDMSSDAWNHTDRQLERLGPIWISDKIESLIRAKASESQGAIRSESLRDAAPELSPFLHRVATDRSITALIAPNDTCLYLFYYWLIKMGVSMPEDLSLISFDNYHALNSLPLSTIDFGAAHLGYCAAHTIIGDIPIAADKAGNISGRCALKNRGSLGIKKKP